ncbi:MAG: dienelactone hydrolase family protein [Actinomycetota bacterium]
MKERRSRYRDEDIVYAGISGEDLTIESANPTNYFEAITKPNEVARVEIDGKLFIPRRKEPLPAVIIVPGSLGIGPNHERHAQRLVELGIAACVVDPFGARSVESTVGDQTAYSFAASAFDVLATLAVLRDRPEIDANRIAAQGHSRGGAAVTIASCRQFASPIVGPETSLAAAYAAYPWCGHQFTQPNIGSTRYRAIIGESDEWCSVQQVQAQVHAMQLTGGQASIRIVAHAHHSFDRAEDPHTIEEAAVAPTAPTVSLTSDGCMIDPIVGEPDPALTDTDVFMTAIVGGHGRRGAAIGGSQEDAGLFTEDMTTFYASL